MLYTRVGNILIHLHIMHKAYYYYIRIMMVVVLGAFVERRASFM